MLMALRTGMAPLLSHLHTCRMLEHCTGSGRALGLESRVLWVRVPSEVADFALKNLLQVLYIWKMSQSLMYYESTRANTPPSPSPSPHLPVHNDLYTHGVLIQKPLDGSQTDPQVVSVEDLELLDRLKFVHMILSYLEKQPRTCTVCHMCIWGMNLISSEPQSC